MEDNFESSIVCSMLKPVREMNKLDRNLEILINKIENKKINRQQILKELKVIKHSIWGMD